ncbi:hypothetical protein EV2_047756 [Malus domestica]
MKVDRRDPPCLLKRCRLRKLKTSFAVCKGPPAAESPVIGMTSSNGKKNEAVRSEHMAPTMLRMACTIVDNVAQRKGHIMPLVPKSVPRRPLRAKSGSPLEMLTIMKNDKVVSTAKMAIRPTPFTAKTDSPAGKEETARVGSYEKSTKLASGEVAEICVLLKPDLLEDIDICAKYSKVTNEVAKTMVAEAYTSTEEIKRLNSELVALKGSNISALLLCISELRFAVYANDEELIASYNQVIHFKRIVDRLEAQVLELQGVLKINESLKKEVDELQRVRVGLLEEDEQLKGETDWLEAGAAMGEALDDATAKSVVAAEGVATE